RYATPIDCVVVVGRCGWNERHGAARRRSWWGWFPWRRWRLPRWRWIPWRVRRWLPRRLWWRIPRKLQRRFSGWIWRRVSGWILGWNLSRRLWRQRLRWILGQRVRPWWVLGPRLRLWLSPRRARVLFQLGIRFLAVGLLAVLWVLRLVCIPRLLVLPGCSASL